MAVEFNHTIVWARDSQTSAAFLAEVLGLSAPKRWGPFVVVAADNGTNIDFMDADGEITPQHYAFLVSEFRVRRDLRSDPRADASLLERPRTNPTGRDKSPRWWARSLFRRS